MPKHSVENLQTNVTFSVEQGPSLFASARAGEHCKYTILVRVVLHRFHNRFSQPRRRPLLGPLYG